jgi:hypothetical protein
MLLANKLNITQVLKCQNVPILKVPDIARTIEWYKSIGFECTGTNHIWEPGCELNWAELSWQDATFMLYPWEHENPSIVKDAGCILTSIRSKELLTN